MPPRRNHHRKNNKTPIAGAMANCVFPKDILLSILTRLPVKSIVRFKSVCKPWCKLFATPRFTKMHHFQHSENPENQSAIIYSLTAKHYHTLSLFKIESDEKEPVNLDHPYPDFFYGIDFVGCCYGLLCLSYPSYGQWIDLWNPATKLYKHVPLPKLETGEGRVMVSIGFGWDCDVDDDFKVVRIVPWEKKTTKKGNKINVGGVEVYSSKSDSWKTIKVDFEFRVLATKCDAIVNGNPYWVARIDDSGCLVWFEFNVRKMMFRFVPVLGLDFKLGDKIHTLVDWKGSLAAIVCNKDEQRVLSLDVWVFDYVGKMWRKNHRFGPIELKVERFLQCTKNGRIFGECCDGELFMFDPENGVVKEIVIDGAEKESFQIHGYTESLAHIEGMGKKKVETEEDEKELDDLVDSFMTTLFRKINV